ncbi:zinc finger translocation-associated protein isoform 3-T3 [Clarias gariepinus]|uniref:zinc finger translocation-associated protein isoform X3 n=1 Tax=Clarias gariepinus TaxID=13013 RepID=UPI00234C29BA|nr:zinc finger translocation-associated protein isoform X3 [Clarias gariepinus]
MEEKESMESEPGVQTESLSLIISDEGEEEASPPYSASAQLAAGEEDMTNGHIRDDSQAFPIAHVESPGTSYWSVSESPESPFLLSPVPGPSRQKTSPAKSGRASRTGHSRIPGRDHRRYYHEHWRTEYLMDFDPKRNGMICMVCGSSLATLKLSTIKRHIRQKHPDSLLWSASDKELIRSGWENHLNLETSKTSCPDTAITSEPEETVKCASLSTDKPGSAVIVKTEAEPEPRMVSSSSAQETQGVSAEMLERYVNDSLHAWFRQEFLMEYQAEASRLVCMVCSCPLPSLHLDHIKNHVLEQHPNSLVYSAEEKHRILQSWAQSQAVPSDTLVESKKLSMKPSGKQSGIKKEDGDRSKVMSAPIIGRNTHYPGKDQRRNYQVHWRMEYLMDYDCRRHGLICMVCGATLATLKVSTIKRHIQQVHPHSLYYSPEQKQQAVEGYNQATLHFAHSDNCFSGSDHSQVAQTNTKAEIE